MKIITGIFIGGRRPVAVLADQFKWFIHKRCSSIYFSSAWLCLLCIGIVTPLLQSQLYEVSFFLFCLLFLLSLTLVLIRHRLRRSILVCSLVIAFLLGWCYSSSIFQAHIDQILSAEYEGINQQVSGEIIGLPVKKAGNVSFTFRVKSKAGEPLFSGTLIKLSCYRCPYEFRAGERWRLTVRLKRPHGYASWGAFDYEKYLFRHQMIAKGYLRVKEDNRLLLRPSSLFDTFRESIKQRLQLMNADESVGFAMIHALALGDKSLISSAQKKVFQQTGVSHLMAISGLHVGLVFIAVSFLSRWFSYPFARIYTVMPRQFLVYLPSLACAYIYSGLAGFSVSTQRAFIMLCVFVICRLLARDVSLQKVLLVAASIILLIDPFSILDVGFWLSCGAVFVISCLDIKPGLWSLLRLQPRLWLGMLPMSAIFFAQISLISPLVNILAVPLFCVVLIPLTLLALVLMLIGFEQLSAWLFGGLDYCFSSIYRFLSFLSRADFATIDVVQWSWPHTVLLGIAITLYGLGSKKQCVAWALLCVCLYVPPTKFFNNTSRDTQLQVTLLDVGQGLSMVVQITGSKNYVLVYDTGPRYASGFTTAEAVVVPFLRSKGISFIDRLVISHADNDHIGGYPYLMSEIDVGDVLTSRTDVLPSAQACLAGQKWSIGVVKFEMISPDANTPAGSNNLSCVLRLDYGDTSVLVTGDIEKQVERYLLKAYADQTDKLLADIVLVPHQGSKTSSTVDFIDTVQPELALIAAGYRNHYGHPHDDVVARYSKRGIDLVSTIDNGSVVININQEGWYRESYRVAKRGFWHHQKKPNWD